MEKDEINEILRRFGIPTHLSAKINVLIGQCEARAWDEGWVSGNEDTIAREFNPPGPNGPVDPTPNPYLQTK